ncbi:hypothetical protein [Arthrobacter dokdonensis]|uniref:hypothetical protein n=1 Tax=Arthrobacter dokdonellae TaxID=2211210 RepID=UPI000DE59F2F|nr:hypothetical protein [Arthrobacter dokdonellae]
MTTQEQPANASYADWERALNRRNVNARLAALAALGDRPEEAKKYARTMLAADDDMVAIAAVLDSEPISGDA